MLKLTKLLTLYIFCCFSCADKTSSIPKVINTKFANKISLELSDSVFFSIDSTTSIYTPSLQYFEAKRNILAFLNTNNNSAYLFDYESRKLNKVIRFENEGPNGVGPIEGFKIHNFDTFMVNSRYKLFLTDTTGKPFFNFDFYKNRPPDLEVTGLIANETKRPMEIMGNKAYVDVMPDVDFSDLDQISQSKVKFILDLKTNSYTADLNYTDNYLEGVFGVHYLEFISSTYNPNTKKFIYSFPANSQIIETDHKLIHNEYYAGSTCCNEIPYQKTKNPSKKEYHQHYATSPFFDNIKYDKYRDLYYRVVMLPMSVENFTARNWKREIVIIILDSSFNKIGEVSFDKNANLNPDMMYITPDGVNIHKTGKKEDFLCFYTFTIKNI